MFTKKTKNERNIFFLNTSCVESLENEAVFIKREMKNE